MIREVIEMRERRGRLREGPRMVRRLILLLVLSAGLICGAPVFAEDEPAGDGPEMTVTVGENGTVNGHREDFTLNMTPGENITLVMRGDTGFVVDEVLINDAPLEEEDMAEIIGEPEASLKLEGIDSNLSVEVMFERDETGEGDEEDGEETEEGGSSVDEGPADDQKEESEETEQMTETGDEENGGDPGSENETGAPEGSDDPEKSDGDAPDDDDAPNGSSGETVDAVSPKTGDALPLIVLLIFAASATLIGITCCGRLWRNSGRTRP